MFGIWPDAATQSSCVRLWAAHYPTSHNTSMEKLGFGPKVGVGLRAEREGAQLCDAYTKQSAFYGKAGLSQPSGLSL